MAGHHSSTHSVRKQPSLLFANAARVRSAVVLSLLILLSGCSAIHQPYTRTIEHKLEVLNRIPKSEYQPIDLRLLGQTPPPEHLISDGDILGIYIEGLDEAAPSEMPVRFPDDRFVSPAIGYPIPVRNGGYIRVPHVGVLRVRGMTVWQVEERIRQILTTGPDAINIPDKAQIHVSLMWKRAVNVMVVRQEEVAPTKLLAPSNGTDADRRSGQVVALPAFRNDVLNALLETGGLPNDQAENAVYIFKRNDRRIAGQAGITAAAPMVPQVAFGSQQPFVNPTPVQMAAYTSIVNRRPGTPIAQGGIQQVAYSAPTPTTPPAAGNVAGNAFASGMSQPLPPLLRGGHTEPISEPARIVQPPCQTCVPDSRHPNAIRIPLTMANGELLPFSQNDVILEDGDIVLVESRENEHFFTAGLLGGGQYSLPRSQDIDVLDAVLLADTYSRSTQLNSPTRAIGGVSALNRDVTVGASRVIIERKTPEGRTRRFRVSLYAAMKNPDQRVIIEPGDRLYLEYTPVEACLAFFERHLLDPVLTGSPAVLTN